MIYDHNMYINKKEHNKKYEIFSILLDYLLSEIYQFYDYIDNNFSDC